MAMSNPPFFGQRGAPDARSQEGEDEDDPVLGLARTVRSQDPFEGIFRARSARPEDLRNLAPNPGPRVDHAPEPAPRVYDRRGHDDAADPYAESRPAAWSRTRDEPAGDDHGAYDDRAGYSARDTRQDGYADEDEWDEQPAATTANARSSLRLGERNEQAGDLADIFRQREAPAAAAPVRTAAARPAAPAPAPPPPQAQAYDQRDWRDDHEEYDDYQDDGRGYHDEQNAHDPRRARAEAYDPRDPRQDAYEDAYDRRDVGDDEYDEYDPRYDVRASRRDYDEADEYDDYEDDEEEEVAPRRRGGGLLFTAVLGLGVVGAGAFGYWQFAAPDAGSGGPAVISAETAPTKVAPADSADTSPAEERVPTQERFTQTPQEMPSAPPRPSTDEANPMQPRLVKTYSVRPERPMLNDDRPGLIPDAASPFASVVGSPELRTATPSGGVPIPPGTWTVQLPAELSEGAARSSFAGLQQQLPGILGGKDAHVQQTTMNQQVAYRVQIPMQNKSSAVQLCTNLKAKRVDCLVSNN